MRLDGTERRWSLRGKGGRAIVGLVVLALALVAAQAAPAKADKKKLPETASIPAELLAAAEANKKQEFDVLILGDGSERSSKLAKKLAKLVADDSGGAKSEQHVLSQQVKDQFVAAPALYARLSGKEILKLAKEKGLLSITRDGNAFATGRINPQNWPSAIKASWLWSTAYSNLPAATIAIVDSGIDNSTGILGNRLIERVQLTSSGDSPGDGRGHGTFAAAMAAGDDAFSGVADTARIVDVDVINDEGSARTSDVIRGCDWIYQNKDRLGIRVANFSLHSALASSFLYDPLNKCVEKLWHSGVVVVAAAGNYNTGGLPNGVLYAPGNDPFVITVGALDTNGTSSTSDDFIAPWSAFGYTRDGFAKPDLGAPGRYLVAKQGSSSSLRRERPGALVNGGTHIQLSGTSFAAPMVAGAAAVLLGLHPDWTPDQVKGALMISASATGAVTMASGVGELNLQALMAVTSPPNPNASLSSYVTQTDAGLAFNGDQWAADAQSSASWSSASWSSASWSSASWSSASWSSASWSSASWSSASWSSASWSSASWASSSQASNADEDGSGTG